MSTVTLTYCEMKCHEARKAWKVIQEMLFNHRLSVKFSRLALQNQSSKRET